MIAFLFGELTRENHRLTYQPVLGSGLTEEQLEAERKRVKNALAAMKKKLDYARTRPEIWSRIMFLTGSGFAGVGAIAYVLNRSRVS